MWIQCKFLPSKDYEEKKKDKQKLLKQNKIFVAPGGFWFNTDVSWGMDHPVLCSNNLTYALSRLVYN